MTRKNETRSMEIRVGSTTVYRSTFDPKRGIMARVVETAEHYRSPWEGHGEEMEKRFGRTRASSDIAFSPVPETVDISITDKCGFGCTYCYQDSRPERDHAPKELVETVLRGFDEPPYQIAIGGGEPTMHPDFETILRTAREIGTVPNYTTAGHHMTDSIIRTTNEVCGGVAMTYHAFKGLDWFVKRYASLKEQLTVQLNVHLIADVNVVENLRALLSRIKDTGPLRIVLLAYYPDVGRASMDTIMTKQVYDRELPVALREARAAGYQVAFSEGLLPYFLSRPEVDVTPRFAMRSEGLFSCYFDTAGEISASSFAPGAMLFNLGRGKNAFNTRSQLLWQDMWVHGRGPDGDACGRCRFERRCATPSPFHYALCAFAPHNAARRLTVV
jgi:MoaA/NifB/PqqE/SkfB family radical SAM enzyme